MAIQCQRSQRSPASALVPESIYDQVLCHQSFSWNSSSLELFMLQLFQQNRGVGRRKVLTFLWEDKKRKTLVKAFSWLGEKIAKATNGLELHFCNHSVWTRIIASSYETISLIFFFFCNLSPTVTDVAYLVPSSVSKKEKKIPLSFSSSFFSSIVRAGSVCQCLLSSWLARSVIPFVSVILESFLFVCKFVIILHKVACHGLVNIYIFMFKVPLHL